MRVVVWSRLMLMVAITLSPGASINRAFGGAPAQSSYGPVDLDPLRQYLPRQDIYMPVPGGIVALTDEPADARTIEERAATRHGGMIVGYCLKASCRHVTHLAVLQVCSNRIGGPNDANQLVLAVVRLPYGKTPGFLKSLQGRDYARNFVDFGPFNQHLPSDSTVDVEALYALSADGMGPVAPLEYRGPVPKQPQSHETIALHLTMLKNARGITFPRFEVRHLCQQPVS